MEDIMEFIMTWVIGIAVFCAVVWLCISAMNSTINKQSVIIKRMGYENTAEVRQFCYVVDISLEQFISMPAYQKAYIRFQDGDMGNLIMQKEVRDAKSAANSAMAMGAASMAMSSVKRN
jgi:hypothetical protein